MICFNVYTEHRFCSFVKVPGCLISALDMVLLLLLISDLSIATDTQMMHLCSCWDYATDNVII